MLGSDGSRDSSPCRDGGSTVRADTVIGEIQDARCRLGEEDEEADVEEDGDGGTAQLRNELVLGAGTDQVAGLEITSHAKIRIGKQRGTTDRIG